MSLAQTAAASGYCKPRFVAEPELKIVAGRHPMVGSLGRVISSDLMPNPTGGNAERRGICPIWYPLFEGGGNDQNYHWAEYGRWAPAITDLRSNLWWITTGKSSTVRAMVSALMIYTFKDWITKIWQALIVCMAQIGSFVPAASVILSVHDSVQTWVIHDVDHC